MPALTNKNTIIRQLLKDFPNNSKRSIAAKAAHDYPMLFTVESARFILRSITGSAGDYHKKIMKNQVKHEPQLPESKAKEREFYKVERKNILWLSDIHIPNQNNKALELAVEYGKKQKVDCIILGGDVMDNTPFTAHDAPPPSPNDVREYFEMTQQFLEWLRSKFPKAHIIWIEGNHCYIKGTEVLTDSGFKMFEDLTDKDLVAQFDNKRNISFSKPLNILSRQYNGVVYDIKHNFSRQIVTDLHDVVVNGKKKKAKDLINSDLDGIFGNGFINNKDYPIDDNMLKFLVNLICDGCVFVTKGKNSEKVRFQFKLSKERKINNLKNILNNLGLDYTYKICKKTGVNKLQPYYIRLYKKDVTKHIFNLIDNKKEFPSFFAKLSKRQAEIVLNEISITDGTVCDNSISWVTTSKNDCEVIQQMCIFNGINCFISKYDNKSGFNNGKLQYKTKIKILKPLLTKNIKSYQYNGIVNCVQMPLGTVVTRYDGKVAFSGNCNWMMRWLMKKAPILFNDPYYHLPQRLDLKKYNIDFLEQHVILQIGKLHATHGHTIVKGVFAPVNAARGVFMKTKSNYIIGHCHTTSQHLETNIKGEQIGCWSTGCLCELSPSYDPHNTKHNLGFAHIVVDDKGGFVVHNKMIVNNTIR